MSTTRLQKKFIFLKYEYSRLWNDVPKSLKTRPFTLSEKFESLLGGNAAANVQRWISGKAVSNADFRGWSGKICERLGVEPRFDLFEDSVRSYEFGALLGLSRTVCKYLVDLNYNENHEMISSIVYDRSAVESFIYDIAGVYELKLDVPGEDRCHTASLQVRYFLPVASRNAQQKYRVRCKVNILASHESHNSADGKIVEYDGYLSYQTGHMFFIFESRYFLAGRRMLTLSFDGQAKTIGGKQYLIGDYLRSEPLGGSSRRSGVALLRNIARDRRRIAPGSSLFTIADDPDYENLMHQTPRSDVYGDISRDYHHWMVGDERMKDGVN
jgi:hypothetical protein